MIVVSNVVLYCIVGGQVNPMVWLVGLVGRPI
jgi:hypothetical protein